MKKCTTGTTNNGPAQAEDLALKSAAAFFGEELIQWLGIKEKVLRTLPTEIVALEARHMYEDFLYEMEHHILFHFEFESDALSIDDLRRFRDYEASTARIYRRPVITFVICSSKIREIRDQITEGINTYRVQIIRLKDENANEILEKLMKKPADKLEKSDLIPLLFSPLMDGPSGQNERILKSIRILRKAEQTILPEDIRKMEAILYILATKFLSGETLEKIKEEIAMTKLGQMIWDDALEKGIAQGREEGREEGKAAESERYNHLILVLNQENRLDQIVKIASDREYRESLFRKYGI